MTSNSIHDILAEFREAARDKRNMGDKFERLFANYLVTEPYYKDRFSQVWMWSEWPGRGNKPDTGIDLVAEERDGGGLCAIQCKFYDPDSRIEKAHLDSFFATSAKAPFASRIVVTTTDNWSKHAEDLLEDERIPSIRIRLQDLQDSAIDWSQFSLSRPDKMKLRKKYAPRPHQQEAIDDVIAGLKEAERGKLIMACGTGKTFTALKIAEKFAANGQDKHGHVLFLVPSIALLAQTLKEWTIQSSQPMHALAVCSDTAVGKEEEDIRVHDLPFPATTDGRRLAKQLAALKEQRPLTVVFSTYQSIQAIHEAQKHDLPDFDLIICDEAHRTTGVTLANEDESHFVKVHDGNYIKARKRLYMTATPRIYADAAKSKAKEAEAELASMDDETLFGREFHRLGFGEAISQDLLADYKVLVLAVDEKFVSTAFQQELAQAAKQKGKGYDDYFTDLVKITGCWNGLSKRMVSEQDAALLAGDDAPMRRAVAFSRSIAGSKQIKELFAGIVEKNIEQAPEELRDALLRCEVDHVDGGMNALVRNRKLDWLKADTEDDGSPHCRILSNARCLSEGVDVPALDAVLFLNPRNSIVDVVQAVGRVMRRAEGKKYGYIILPVGIPADMSPEEALKDNERYEVIWKVLQALRSHDERIEAAINKIDLTGKQPNNISIIGVGGPAPAGEDDGTGKKQGERPQQYRLDFPNLDQWRDAIFAKLVLKCGDRRYWESWAKDVAKIADTQISRIKGLLEADGKVGGQARKAFDKFLTGLRGNLNPAVSESDAIEMLAQHLITQPVFDALFEGYEFTKHNPVSLSMQKMLDILRDNGLDKEPQALQKFYESVRQRAKIEGVEATKAAEARQRIIIELYDKFFRTAFPRMAERLGIVYTPVEVVDFILNSADWALRQEFGVGLADRGVHVLDPFTGTGTFIVRLLQSGLIAPEQLERKFKGELHANEIVLLAYYIAAVNIEYAYHLRRQQAGIQEDYQPFEGIVLTDTFQLTEGKGSLEEAMFPDNNKRASRQKEIDIRVIVGNPPYSAQQVSENDGNKNLKYPALDEHIRTTYAAKSNAGLLKNLYDSYVRSIRWASNRVKDKGIVCFVTNGSFIDANNMDGLRKTLAQEFSRIYVFNLRGNTRTSGEQARKEGGQMFGSGSRATVAITLLVKDSSKQSDGAISYHDIGDYLSREKKLQIIQDANSAMNIPWREVIPSEQGDWITDRDPAFSKFIPLSSDEDAEASIFATLSQGVHTARDAWVYNDSKLSLTANMRHTIASYNEELSRYAKAVANLPPKEKPAPERIVDMDARKVSWSSSLLPHISRNRRAEFDASKVVTGMYRPFEKRWLYLDGMFNDRPGKMRSYFPNEHLGNKVISVTGIGAGKAFSGLMMDCLPNYHTLDTGKSFPLHYYVEAPKSDLLSSSSEGYILRDAITDAALAEFCKTYKDDGIGKEDLFYYVYGILHSPEYKTRFEADLKKQLPRMPYAKDFWTFSTAGRDLAHWHLNYETIEPYPLAQIGELDLGDGAMYRVQKMAWAKKKEDGKTVADKSTLIYNSRITLTGIPQEAHEYVVNGKPAIEWIIERYQVTTDKDSGIVNDPNDWATEHNDPAYILNLVKRIVRVSVETVKIVKALPALEELN